MANAKITDLTQATGSELTDNSLVYVVTDPSGTPSSKKSAVSRLGLPPKSLIETQLLYGTIGATGSGQSITLGTCFLLRRSGQECTGVRLYWSGTSLATLSVKLYPGGGGAAIRSATITTTGVAGYYEVAFNTPYSFTDTTVSYVVSAWANTSLQLGEAQRVLPTGSSIFAIAPGFVFRDYILASDGKFSGGDNNPTQNNTQVLYPIEPIING